jgi:hypothetical protein
MVLLHFLSFHELKEIQFKLMRNVEKEES